MHLMLHRCHRHGHWRFNDGSKSAEFADITSGAVWFLQAVLQRKAGAEELPRAIELLRLAELPEGNFEDKMVAIEFYITDSHTRPSSPPKDVN